MTLAGFKCKWINWVQDYAFGKRIRKGVRQGCPEGCPEGVSGRVYDFTIIIMSL